MDHFKALIEEGDLEKACSVFGTLNQTEVAQLANHDAAKKAVYLIASADEKILRDMLEAKFPANDESSTGETPLHAAVKAARPESLRALLESDTCLPNAVDGHNQTALYRAAEYGNTSCIMILIDNSKVNINAEDSWCRTALHWTCQKGLYDCTQKLLEKGAKLAMTVTKETPPHWAVRGGHLDQVQLLLKYFPDIYVYAPNDRNETELDMAKLSGFQDIADYLLDQAESKGQSPLSTNIGSNEEHVHITPGVKKMQMKPKGGVRKLTIKRPGMEEK